MLAFLSGIIESKLINPNRCIIEVNGLGFLVYLSQSSWLALEAGKTHKLYTSLNISPEAVKVYGFTNAWEQSLYELINSVKGIGAKSALALLDALSPEQIVQAIAEGSADTLSTAQGIGQKTAERIIFELKSKISQLQVLSGNVGNVEINKYAETESILRSLGYKPSEIENAIQANAASKDLIKDCLTWLSGATL